MFEYKIEIINTKPISLGRLCAEGCVGLDLKRILMETCGERIIPYQVSLHRFDNVNIVKVKISSSIELEVGESHITLFEDGKPKISNSTSEIIKYLKKTNNS